MQRYLVNIVILVSKILVIMLVLKEITLLSVLDNKVNPTVGSRFLKFSKS